jgi:hypothetical protein
VLTISHGLLLAWVFDVASTAELHATCSKKWVVAIIDQLELPVIPIVFSWGRQNLSGLYILLFFIINSFNKGMAHSVWHNSLSSHFFLCEKLSSHLITMEDV